MTDSIRSKFFLLGLLILPVHSKAGYEVIGDQTPGAAPLPLTSQKAQAHLEILKTKTMNPSSMATQMVSAGAYIHGASLRTLPVALPSRATGVKLQTQPLPTRNADALFPPKLSSLADAVTFIQGQRNKQGPYFSESKKGLPNTFYVPSSLDGQVMNNFYSDRVIREGAFTYDTSLAILALVQNGNLAEARDILDIYERGGVNVPYGMLELRAVPSFRNGFAFVPLDETAYYFFDITRANGQFTFPQTPAIAWDQFQPHTGPNAWLIIAATRYIEAVKQKEPESVWIHTRNMVEAVGNAMLRLQDDATKSAGPDATQGCVRYAPKTTFHEPGTSDPFLECNSENNISAFAAFNALYKLTGDERYRKGADSILRWLSNGTFYNPNTGEMQSGMLDPDTGAMFMGATYSESEQCWVLQPIIATDSGGTWTLSSLGPETFDYVFGQEGGAYRAWMTIRRKMGRTAERGSDGQFTMSYANDSGRLDGLDFSDVYSKEEGLITPEWTAGGINAIKQLLSYYRDGNGRGQLLASQIAGLAADLDSMQRFIGQNRNAYAFGPGLQGARQGRTGFNWYCPPDTVTAMASIYGLLTEDPLAWVRR